MLRLSKKFRSALAVATLAAASPSFAQQGLADRLAAADKQLDADVQACKPINVGEYQALLNEAAKNKQRAAKAAKKGVPVNQAQVDADLAAASALFNKAVAALVRQCMRQAQQAQQPKETSLKLSPFARDLLAAHNAARADVGAAPLHWNEELAAHAAARAADMARIGQLVHAPREGRGTERENIGQAPLAYSPMKMMEGWTSERRHFVPGIFPNVCDTGGDCSRVWHYTQMIWSQTTDVGCGMAPGGGFNWLVCRYSPGGNRDGRPVLADNSGVAPATSETPATAPPKPPPPPTASDEAPGGNEDNHPLVGYGAEAFIRHSAAVDCGNAAAAEAELAKLRYALDELRKRLKAAKKAGKFSTVKPEDVQRQINLLESFLRAAEQRKQRGACPTPPPPPPPPK